MNTKLLVGAILVSGLASACFASGPVGHSRAATAGLLALGTGNLDTAISSLNRAGNLAEQAFHLGNPNVFFWAVELVESLSRLRRDAADDAAVNVVLEMLDQCAETTGLGYPRMAAERAHGIRASGLAEALEHFARAKDAVPGGGVMLFEYGRVLLAEGESLRRHRKPCAARHSLAEAVNVFDGLSARPWSARAVSELAAAGGSTVVGRTEAQVDDVLTPQEIQVARRAGRGMSNTEIALTLYMSQKTVEAHLTRTYRKLGVRSRTQLANVLFDQGLLE